MLFLVLFLLSVLGGFFSGLLGVGGAVILIPLLSTVPPLLGAGSLTLHEIAGITMVQVLMASSIGAYSHRREGHFDAETVLSLGIPMGICSLVGALASKWVSEAALQLLFAILLLIAIPLLWQPASDEAGLPERPYVCQRGRSVISGSTIGLLAGMIGAGGGFILIPVMVRLLGVPMRMAVGSSLGIILIGALLGALGKLATHQVPWNYLTVVLPGTLLATGLGTKTSHKISPAKLRKALLSLMLVILAKTMISFANTAIQ